MRPKATIKSQFVEQLKLLQSMFLSDFGWNLSTTWTNVSYSPLDDLVKNTYLNSRKGDAPKVDVEELSVTHAKPKSLRRRVEWNAKPITSVANTPLSPDAIKVRETDTAGTLPHSILSTGNKRPKRFLKLKAFRGSESLLEANKIGLLDNEASTLSQAMSPPTKLASQPSKIPRTHADVSGFRRAGFFRVCRCDLAQTDFYIFAGYL